VFPATTVMDWTMSRNGLSRGGSGITSGPDESM